MASKRYEEGIKIRRRVLGDDYVDRALAKSKGNPLTEELQVLVTESAWGGIWARPGLELKVRSMLNLAILSALNRPHEFEIHMRGAINNGVTREETKEILLQCAGYCGWPAAIDSFRIADRVFAETEAAG